MMLISLGELFQQLNCFEWLRLSWEFASLSSAGTATFEHKHFTS